MSLYITANLKQIPVDSFTETFNPSFIPGPAKVLQFPPQTPRCETCNQSEKACNCDAYLGSCEGCGNHVYGGDLPRVVDGVITCDECLHEEKSWKKVVQPVVFAVAA